MKPVNQERGTKPRSPHSYTTQLAPHEVDERHPDPKKVDKENYLRMALVHPSTDSGPLSDHIPEVMNDDTFQYECVEVDEDHVVFDLSIDTEHEERITSYIRLNRSDICWQFQGHGKYEAAFHLRRLGEEDGKAKYEIVLEEDSPE